MRPGVTATVDNFAMAFATLRANPLRSLLTLVGIVIGAATVVAMMSLTEGLRVKINTDLSMLGAGSFYVQRFPPISFGDDWHKYARRKMLTPAEGESLRDLPGVAHVSIEQWNHGLERLWTRERSTKSNIQVVGTDPDYEYTNAITVARGRFINEVDLSLGRRVIVIGADVADVLFPGADPIGQEVRIRAASFSVCGVLTRMGTILGLESRDAIGIVPMLAFAQSLGGEHGYGFGVQATSADELGKAQDAVITQLRRLRGVPDGQENDFEVFTNDSMSEMFNNLAALVAVATFGVCALALLVGGIGIMNIMLVSVTERTSEIGLRKALGARRRRILVQFMIEAVTLSLVGGLSGVGLGMAVAIGVRELVGVPAVVPLWAVLLALGASSGTGLLFGIYPANRASRLDPVEAMRVEA